MIQAKDGQRSEAQVLRAECRLRPEPSRDSVFAVTSVISEGPRTDGAGVTILSPAPVTAVRKKKPKPSSDLIKRRVVSVGKPYAVQG